MIPLSALLVAQALEEAMPLKPRIKVKAGSKKLEPGYDLKDGKIVPVEKRKPVPQRIADRNAQEVEGS